MAQAQMETITFELIRRVQREELRSPRLCKLPERFFEQVRKYLEHKRKLMEQKEDRLMGVEVRNAEKLVRKIKELREKKILNLAFNAVYVGIPVENLDEEEREFFEQVVAMLRKRKAEFEQSLYKFAERVKLVIFKSDFPQFVGVNGLTYGPFKAGDIARLPEEHVEVLKQRDLVREFEVSK